MKCIACRSKKDRKKYKIIWSRPFGEEKDKKDKSIPFETIELFYNDPEAFFKNHKSLLSETSFLDNCNNSIFMLYFNILYESRTKKINIEIYKNNFDQFFKEHAINFQNFIIKKNFREPTLHKLAKLRDKTFFIDIITKLSEINVLNEEILLVKDSKRHTCTYYILMELKNNYMNIIENENLYRIFEEFFNLLKNKYPNTINVFKEKTKNEVNKFLMKYSLDRSKFLNFDSVYNNINKVINKISDNKGIDPNEIIELFYSNLTKINYLNYLFEHCEKDNANNYNVLIDLINKMFDIFKNNNFFNYCLIDHIKYVLIKMNNESQTKYAANVINQTVTTFFNTDNIEIYKYAFIDLCYLDNSTISKIFETKFNKKFKPKLNNIKKINKNKKKNISHNLKRKKDTKIIKSKNSEIYRPKYTSYCYGFIYYLISNPNISFDKKYEFLNLLDNYTERSLKKYEEINQGFLYVYKFFRIYNENNNDLEKLYSHKEKFINIINDFSLIVEFLNRFMLFFKRYEPNSHDKNIDAFLEYLLNSEYYNLITSNYATKFNMDKEKINIIIGYIKLYVKNEFESSNLKVESPKILEKIKDKIILSNKDLCLSYIMHHLDKKEKKFIYYLLSSKFDFSNYILDNNNLILDALKDENDNYIEINLEKFDYNNSSFNTFLDLIIENKISISSFSLTKYCFNNQNKISLKLLIYCKLYLHHKLNIFKETLFNIIKFYLNKLKDSWKESIDFSKLKNVLDSKIWVYILAILDEDAPIEINIKNLDFFFNEFLYLLNPNFKEKYEKIYKEILDIFEQLPSNNGRNKNVEDNINDFLINNFLYLISPNFKKNNENQYNEIFDAFERLPIIDFKVNNNEDSEIKYNENEDNEKKYNENKYNKGNKIFDEFFFLIALINMKIKFGNHNPLILFRYAMIFNRYKYIYNIYADFIEKKKNNDERDIKQHLIMANPDFLEIKELYAKNKIIKFKDKIILSNKDLCFLRLSHIGYYNYIQGKKFICYLLSNIKNKILELKDKIILSNKDLCLLYIMYHLNKKKNKFIYYLLSSKFDFSNYILDNNNLILDALKDENDNYIEINLEKFDYNNSSFNTFLDLIIENKISISSFSLTKYCFNNQNKISLKLLIYCKLYLHHEWSTLTKTLSNFIKFYSDKLRNNWEESIDFSKFENELDDKIIIYILAILEEHKTIGNNIRDLYFFFNEFLYLLNPNFKEKYEKLYKQVLDAFEQLPNENKDNENKDNINEGNEDNENKDNINKDKEDNEDEGDEIQRYDIKHEFLFLIALINMKIKFGNYNPNVLFNYARISNCYYYIYDLYVNFIEEIENNDDKNIIKHFMMAKSEFLEVEQFYFGNKKLLDDNHSREQKKSIFNCYIKKFLNDYLYDIKFMKNSLVFNFLSKEIKKLIKQEKEKEKEKERYKKKCNSIKSGKLDSIIPSIILCLNPVEHRKIYNLVIDLITSSKIHFYQFLHDDRIFFSDNLEKKIKLLSILINEMKIKSYYSIEDIRYYYKNVHYDKIEVRKYINNFTLLLEIIKKKKKSLFSFLNGNIQLMHETLYMISKIISYIIEDRNNFFPINEYNLILEEMFEFLKDFYFFICGHEFYIDYYLNHILSYFKFMIKKILMNLFNSKNNINKEKISEAIKLYANHLYRDNVEKKFNININKLLCKQLEILLIEDKNLFEECFGDLYKEEDIKNTFEFSFMLLFMTNKHFSEFLPFIEEFHIFENDNILSLETSSENFRWWRHQYEIKKILANSNLTVLKNAKIIDESKIFVNVNGCFKILSLINNNNTSSIEYYYKNMLNKFYKNDVLAFFVDILNHGIKNKLIFDNVLSSLTETQKNDLFNREKDLIIVSLFEYSSINEYQIVKKLLKFLENYLSKEEIQKIIFPPQSIKERNACPNYVYGGYIKRLKASKLKGNSGDNDYSDYEISRMNKFIKVEINELQSDEFKFLFPYILKNRMIINYETIALLFEYCPIQKASLLILNKIKEYEYNKKILFPFLKYIQNDKNKQLIKSLGINFYKLAIFIEYLYINIKKYKSKLNEFEKIILDNYIKIFILETTPNNLLLFCELNLENNDFNVGGNNSIDDNEISEIKTMCIQENKKTRKKLSEDELLIITALYEIKGLKFLSIEKNLPRYFSKVMNCCKKYKKELNFPELCLKQCFDIKYNERLKYIFKEKLISFTKKFETTYNFKNFLTILEKECGMPSLELSENNYLDKVLYNLVDNNLVKSILYEKNYFDNINDYNNNNTLVKESILTLNDFNLNATKLIEKCFDNDYSKKKESLNNFKGHDVRDIGNYDRFFIFKNYLFIIKSVCNYVIEKNINSKINEITNDLNILDENFFSEKHINKFKSMMNTINIKQINDLIIKKYSKCNFEYGKEYFNVIKDWLNFVLKNQSIIKTLNDLQKEKFTYLTYFKYLKVNIILILTFLDKIAEIDRLNLTGEKGNFEPYRFFYRFYKLYNFFNKLNYELNYNTNKEKSKENLSNSLYVFGEELLNIINSDKRIADKKNIIFPKSKINISFSFDEEKYEFVETYTGYNLAEFIERKIVNLIIFMNKLNNENNELINVYLNLKDLKKIENDNYIGSEMFYINQNIKQNNYDTLNNFITHSFCSSLYVGKNQELSFNNLELYVFQKFLNNEKNFIKDYLKKTAEQVILPQYYDCLFPIYQKYSKIYFNYYYPCIHLNYYLSKICLEDEKIYQLIDFQNLLTAINNSKFHSNDNLDSFFKLSAINYLTTQDSSLIFIFIKELYDSISIKLHLDHIFNKNDTIITKHYDFKVVPGKKLLNDYKNNEEKNIKILSTKELNPEMLKNKKLKLKANFDGKLLKKSGSIISDANNNKNNNINNDNNNNNIINQDIITSNKSLKKRNLVKFYINCIDKNNKNGIFNLVKNPFFRNNVPAAGYSGHIPLIKTEFYGYSPYELSKKIFNSELVSNINDIIEDDFYSYEEMKELSKKIKMKNNQENDIFDTKLNVKKNTEDVKNPFFREILPAPHYTGHIPFTRFTFSEETKYKYSKKIFNDKFLPREIYNPEEKQIPPPEKKDKFPNVFDLLFSIKCITKNTIVVEQNDITKILEPFLEKEKFKELLNYKFHRKSSKEIPQYFIKIINKYLKSENFGGMKI